MVRRKYLTKGDRRGEVRTGDHEVIRDAEANHLAPNESAEGVGADAGEYCCRVAQSRSGDCHVRRAATQELSEGLDVLQTDTYLQWVDVHPRPADGQDRHTCGHGSSWLST